MCRRLVLLVCVVGMAGLASSAFAGAPPVGWWKFDEGTGNTAYDSSGNSHDGTIGENTAWIPGHIGPHALEFVSGYVNVSDSAQLRPARLTVSVWVNLTASQETYNRLIVKGNDNSETYNSQWSGFGLWFGMKDSGGSDHGLSLLNPLWPDEWIHFAAAYDGNAVSLYVNGELDNSVTTGDFTPLQSGGPLGMGARAPDWDRRMNGSIDDVRIYDYGMTAGEVRELYWEIRDPNLAQWPFPEDGAEDVDPGVVLHWEGAEAATSHDVYFGTNFNDVNSADTTWPVGTSVYKGSVDVNYYDPDGNLELGETYFWRIDEVTGSGRSTGAVWSFTVDDGKASGPSPGNNELCAQTDANLSWTPGVLATSHDVYFGTDFDNVNSAIDPYSPPGRGNQEANNFDPGPLRRLKTYYWRIDEVGDTTFVRGDVWTFTVEGAICLKVDLGLPQCLDGGAVVITDPPVAGTVKDGWWGFVASRWADMYMHDAVWEGGEGGQGGPPPDTNGIDGSGVHVALDISNGNGGHHVHGMCRDNLGGGGCPSGSPVGEPIANGWFHNIDWGGECTGDIHMRIAGLPPGRYKLRSYHNHWEPRTQKTRNCLTGISNMPPMEKVYAMSLPVEGEMVCEYVLGLGTGTGVTSLVEAYNIDVTSVLTDADVATSTIEFETDGSDVLVVYEGGDNTYPDPARPDREGHKAILNAFCIQLGTAIETAYIPNPADGAENVSPDVVLSWKAGANAVWHDVYLGTDSDDVNEADTSSSVHKGRQEAADTNYAPPEPLLYDQTYYWRIDEVNEPNTWRGKVWSFTTYCTKASNPSPANAAKDVARDVELSWSPGLVAASHDVYFGTNRDDVDDADTASSEYKGGRATCDYDPPGLLDVAATYFWRVDEVNEADTWKGELWSFTVTGCFPVDDMESYNDSDNIIYDTWLDGFDNLTGSIIDLGVDPDHPVRGGAQSMMFDYGNDSDWGAGYYSETERTFSDPCDWTVFGVKALTLYFYGNPDNDADATEQMYVGLEDSSGAGSYAEVRYGDSGEDMSDIKEEEWHEWNVALADFAGVDANNIKKVCIGFGDRGSAVPGGSGTVYFDDITLCTSRCVLPGPYADLSGDCVVDHKDLKIMADEWLDSGGVVADLYVDDKVDFRDYAILAEGWLEVEGIWP